MLKQKGLEALQIIRIDQIHTSPEQFSPECLACLGPLIGGRPEPHEPPLLMRGLDDILELLALVLGHRPGASPCEVATPMIADQRHELSGRLRVQIRQATIITGIAQLLRLHQLQRPIPRDDNENRFVRASLRAKGSHEIVVAGQDLVEPPVGRLGRRFEVDQQKKTRRTGVDMPFVLFRPFPKRIEVERPERSFGSDLIGVVGHAEFFADKKDVRLHAGEAVLQGLEQRRIVPIVIMGMRGQKRHDTRLRQNRLVQQHG